MKMLNRTGRRQLNSLLLINESKATNDSYERCISPAAFSESSHQLERGYDDRPYAISCSRTIMLVDAIGYSAGALGSIEKALTPSDPHWKRRLKLNLMLANQGLYFAGLASLLGAYFVNTEPNASKAIEIFCLLTCIYTVITVPLLTPNDWPHILPRALGAVLISTGWAMM